MAKRRKVLVTGATGYIGGRLVPRLIAAGYSVRVLVRDPAKLSGVPWAGEVEVVRADLGDADSLSAPWTVSRCCITSFIRWARTETSRRRSVWQPKTPRALPRRPR